MEKKGKYDSAYLKVVTFSESGGLLATGGTDNIVNELLENYKLLI